MILPLAIMRSRIFAISDVHTDYAENLAYVRRLSKQTDFKDDTLICAGDVTDSLDTLRETLQCFTAAFGTVFFTPGNHEFWVRGRSRDAGDSLEKLAAIFALCDELGVRTRPAYAAGAVVAPILSFHHQSWDTEPDITGWRGIPSCERVMSDYRACAWPPPLSMLDDSVALRLDALNDAHAAGDADEADGGGAAADVDASSDPIAIALAMAEAAAPTYDGRRDRTSGAPGGAFEASVAALRAEHPSAPLVTFSHFVPRPELSPEKRFLMFPNLAKVRRRTSAQFVAIPRQTPGAIPL